MCRNIATFNEKSHLTRAVDLRIGKNRDATLRDVRDLSARLAVCDIPAAVARHRGSRESIAAPPHLPAATGATTCTRENLRFRILRATYSSKRLAASRSRSYRLVTGNGGNQDSRRTIQSS